LDKKNRLKGENSMEDKKVLIIDDAESEALLMKSLIEVYGIKCDVALTGEEGLEKLKINKVDLIILDLGLPGINGFEVCRQIKQDAELKDIVVVIVSVKSDVEQIKKAFDVGVDDYVIKPAVPELLANKVKLYLGVK
jgi:PleD family two-component response regulator